ncbi:hypothetical protein F5B18DRAFT_160424 [Nemania serpens]|nr:hypothetical protein F5B18DRAFT_160424 [Nemania serpens]
MYLRYLGLMLVTLSPAFKCSRIYLLFYSQGQTSPSPSLYDRANDAEGSSPIYTTDCGIHCVTTPKVLAPGGGFVLGSSGLMGRRNSSGIAHVALAGPWTNHVKGETESTPWI